MRGHGSLYSINPWLLYKYIIVRSSCLNEPIYCMVLDEECAFPFCKCFPVSRWNVESRLAASIYAICSSIPDVFFYSRTIFISCLLELRAAMILKDHKNLMKAGAGLYERKYKRVLYPR